MSHVVTPALDAAVVAAPRTECALKMAVSIPAFPRMLLSHRAIVEFDAGSDGGKDEVSWPHLLSPGSPGSCLHML